MTGTPPTVFDVSNRLIKGKLINPRNNKATKIKRLLRIRDKNGCPLLLEGRPFVWFVD